MSRLTDWLNVDWAIKLHKNNQIDLTLEAPFCWKYAVVKTIGQFIILIHTGQFLYNAMFGIHRTGSIELSLYEPCYKGIIS